MVRSPLRFVMAGVALLVCGCFGDRAADRTVKIDQIQTTDTYHGRFEIDVSQLPPDAITNRVESGGEGTPVTSLTIDQKYPIRVVLVPIGDDKSTTENQVQRRGDQRAD